MASKEKHLIKKFRICVMGPSYVGKTQVINRFVNNSFSGYYEPTLEPNYYRKAYNLNYDELDICPAFYDLEIIDMFPHDHPFMDEEIELMEPQARKMYDELEKAIKSPFETKVTDEGGVKKPVMPVIERIHAYMFVYDTSNKRTFQAMMCMIDTINELEKTKKKGSAKGPTIVFPKKIVIGNKRDLRKNEAAGKITTDDIAALPKDIKIKEVSALTNQGIAEAFKMLVNDLNKDQVLTKEEAEYDRMRLKRLMDAGKKKNEDGEEDEEEEEAKENQSAKGIAKDDAEGGGGLFACCGPRTQKIDKEDSDDSDQPKQEDEQQSDEDFVPNIGGKKIKKDDDDGDGYFVAERDSEEKKARDDVFQKKNKTDDGKTTVGAQDGDCLIF